MRSPLRAVVDLVPRGTARTPVPIPSRAQSERSIFSGTSSQATSAIDAMGSVGTLFNIVSTTSQAVAKVKWQLWRSAKSGDPKDRVLVADHQALRVWNRPNDFMSGMRFREAQAQHLKLTGEACWVVQRQAPAPWPMGMWPVRPDRITPVPSVETFLAGFVYTSPDGEQVPLGIEDVIRPMMPNPADPYRGMGAVQAILTDLDSERYTAEWNRNFFRNSATPGGIIEVPEGLQDADFRRLQRRWAEQHRGVAAAHRVGILEAGMKWIDRSFSQRDMQFAELRQVGQDVIREAFGFPGFAAGKVTDVNRATAEASDLWFDKHLTVPDLDRIRDAANCEFLPLFGLAGAGLEFDYISPVQGDEEQDAEILVSRSKALHNFTQAGVYGPDALELAGLPGDADFGQPGADPDRILLTSLVQGAPSLAPMILPVLMPGVDWSNTAPSITLPRAHPGEVAPGAAAVPGAPVPKELEAAPKDRGVHLITSAADGAHLMGCMIALVPSAPDAARIAVPGGELADDLHLTLAYLGPDAGDWSPNDTRGVIDAVRSYAAYLPTVDAKIFGAALWNADTDKPAWVWNVGDYEAGGVLTRARATVLAGAEDVLYDRFPVQRTPWAAHVCAAYSADPALLPVLSERMGALIFDRVRVTFGDLVTDIMIGPVPGTELDPSVGYDDHGVPVIEAAMRWVVKAHKDDSTCAPCLAQDGKLYRNRESAYEDYPDGKSYVNCVGAKYGNDCRCTVVKRGRKGGGE